MLITESQKVSLEQLFSSIRLEKSRGREGDDKAGKIRQIISYLEIIDAHIRKLSAKRRLVLTDFGAGNCYLSFLIYHYYTVLKKRDIEIHCIDFNESLMRNSEERARALGFTNMHFHSMDILEFSLPGRVDLSYSLHACDGATDKAIFMGYKLNAGCILSVSCCQHSLKKEFSNQIIPGLSCYKAFKDRLLYMTADAMRAQLLEMKGYKVDIFDFTSSRNSDKNAMIRARSCGRIPQENLQDQYLAMRRGFHMAPLLESLLGIIPDEDLRRKTAS